MPDATIIIPQRGHWELTRQCLATLRAHDDAPWPIIVVDDGSPRALCDLDVSPFSPAEMQRQPQRGVSAAWNRGATAATTRYLVFLNNDTVSTGAWVERLVRPLRGGECVLTGVGMRFERALPDTLLERLALRRFLPGWCFAIAASTFRCLGGFDEALKIYWSDTDLQLRAALQNRGGGRPVLRDIADLPLVHLGHRTAHDHRYLPRQRGQWRVDRGVFIAKWQQSGAAGRIMTE